MKGKKTQTTRLGFQVREFPPLPQEIFPILEEPPGSGARVKSGAVERGERSGEPQGTPARKKARPAGERPAAPGRTKERTGGGLSRAARRPPRGPSVAKAKSVSASETKFSGGEAGRKP